MTSHRRLRLALVALIPAALFICPPLTLSAPGTQPQLSVSDWLFASKGLVERHLRADFEPPELLVLAYDSDWEPALNRILRAARGRTEVAIAPVAEDVDRGFLRRLSRRPGVTTLDTVLDTAWVRDFAPLQLRDALGSVFWYDFPYSDERPQDDAFPAFIAQRWAARYERAWIPVDGGGVISNGEGLCAMTELSVVDTRLDVASRQEISLLLSELGCESMVVVPSLPEEETGHVDMLAQFVSADSLIVASTSPRESPETAAALDEAANRFRKAARALGKPLAITRVPYEVNGAQHLTYINGTVLRGVFLVPNYVGVDRGVQARAYAALRKAMPNRKLVPIEADAMIDRGGAVHCITAGLNPPPYSMQAGARAALTPRARPTDTRDGRSPKAGPRLARRKPSRVGQRTGAGTAPMFLRGLPGEAPPPRKSHRTFRG